ncbi:MAG TPA: DUF718 domain-containing protein [Devosiaceae bacterium]|nr:DUF718 domain-containing protein [Devosiaceae bacterium]
MTAMNIVHMRVKPGKEDEFLAIQRDVEEEVAAGMRALWVIKTGERSYCFVGEWDTMEAIIEARPKMIGQLDRMRGVLEDLGGGRGVTEPYSGAAMVEYKRWSVLGKDGHKS